VPAVQVAAGGGRAPDVGAFHRVAATPIPVTAVTTRDRFRAERLVDMRIGAASS
jgi:hypothetical protein